MTQLQAATITVIEHELNVMRGLRISPDTAVAEVAVKRERLLEAELKEVRAQITRQGLLPFAVGEDEEPVSLAASQQQQAGGSR